MRKWRVLSLLCLAVVVTAAPAFADLIRLHGTIASVPSDERFMLRTDDGRMVPVDFSRDDIDPRRLTVGEGVTALGQWRHGQFDARDVIEDDAGRHHRVHGTIRSVGPGRSLVLATDDGRTLRVDLRRDDIDMRRLTVGEQIAVVGAPGWRDGVFIARDVVEDSTRHQRVHGIIRSMGPGRSLLLATDDGRTIRVDFSRDDIDARLLTVGEGIVVTGRRDDRGVFIARDVVQDESRQWQRVRGAIRRLGPGRALVLATDDGRTLRVDLSRDDIDMRQLRRGDRILVVGNTGVKPGVFTARNVVVEQSPAASPAQPYPPRW
jgi:cytochrome c-type biogenesis protein CcmE